MRRADRLFRLVSSLRRRKVTTASRLAAELGVSERTVYRDVRDLIDSGVPISGEAGVGYSLARGFDLPPLTFNDAELTALALGARLVRAWADPELASAAGAVLDKIEAVLPDRLRGRLASSRVFAPGFHVPPALAAHLGKLRRAVDSRFLTRLRYRKSDGDTTSRTVRPLGLFFWGKTWTMATWCELRGDFRTFRLDRIESLSILGDRFPNEPGRQLGDYLRKVGAPRSSDASDSPDSSSED